MLLAAARAGEAMFLKAMVHLSSSPAKTVESPSQRIKTRMLPESSVMVRLLQDEGVGREESLIMAGLELGLDELTLRSAHVPSP